MKTSPLAGFLLVITVALSVFAAANIYRYFLYTYHLQQVQLQLDVMEQNRLNVQSLANEALHYGKQHPAINPVLQAFGITNTLAAPTTLPTRPR